MALFSGSAADLLKSVGAAVPEQKPMSGLEESQAAKAAMETECHDPNCTHDHDHTHVHSGGCNDAGCTADHGHGSHGHGHAHAAPADGHDHAHAAPAPADGHEHKAHEAHEAHDGHAHEAHDHHAHEKHDGHAHEAHEHHAHESHDHHDHHAEEHAHDAHHEHAEPSEHHIAKKLRTSLEASHVEVVDDSDGCGTKLIATIVSKQFEGKPLPAQHRLVYSALEEEMKTIHALNIKTFTPAKWAARK